MALRYHKLFDLLRRRDMKKGEFMELAKLSWPTMAKLSKGQSINSDIQDRICAALNCQPGDIMEYIPDEEVGVQRYNIDKRTERP